MKKFTTRDYLIMFLYTSFYMVLGMYAFRSFLRGEAIQGCLLTLGCAGWVILYLQFMNNFKKKNE